MGALLQSWEQVVIDAMDSIEAKRFDESRTILRALLQMMTDLRRNTFPEGTE